MEQKTITPIQLDIEKVRSSEDLFLDALLRDIPEGDDRKHSIDLAKANWLSDFHLTCLPFVLSAIRKKLKNAPIDLTYFIDSLIEEDIFFDYLSASGFFDFMEDTVEVKTSRSTRSSHSFDDPLINFQAFRNIVSDTESDDESQRILFEISSTVEILSELLKKEVFGKTDVGKKVARVFTKELIENIKQHSKSTKALVRLKFESDFNIIAKQYGKSPIIKRYLEKHQQYGFFLLTVADNGQGIVTTLKEKYDNNFFKPNVGEKLTEMKNKSTAWWIRRAFDTHVANDTNMRTRIGLKAIYDTVVEYDGVMCVRTEDARYLIVKEPETKAYENSTSFNPYITGTYFLVMLPAKERKKESLEKVKIYTRQGPTKFTDLENYRIESFDIASPYRLSPVTSNIEANQAYIMNTVESIVKTIKIAASNPKIIVEIDFSNGINYKAQDYIHILASVDRELGNKFTSNTILRNVSDDMITALMKSDFAERLSKSERFLLTFGKVDEALLIGCKDSIALEELQTILKGTELVNENETHPSTI